MPRIRGIIPKNHEGVIAEFGRLFILTGKVDPALGRALSTAKEDRETAITTFTQKSAKTKPAKF